MLGICGLSIHMVISGYVINDLLESSVVACHDRLVSLHLLLEKRLELSFKYSVSLCLKHCATGISEGYKLWC